MISPMTDWLRAHPLKEEIGVGRRMASYCDEGIMVTELWTLEHGRLSITKGKGTTVEESMANALNVLMAHEGEG